MKSKENQTLLKFPCEFPLKVLGYKGEEFTKNVIDILHKHQTKFDEKSIKTKPSKNDKYLAMTIVIQAKNKQHLDTIYQELNACKQVVMTL
jgi:uncharacterized protein